jgi:hypothetical protein
MAALPINLLASHTVLITMASTLENFYGLQTKRALPSVMVACSASVVSFSSYASRWFHE